MKVLGNRELSQKRWYLRILLCWDIVTVWGYAMSLAHSTTDQVQKKNILRIDMPQWSAGLQNTKEERPRILLLWATNLISSYTAASWSHIYPLGSIEFPEPTAFWRILVNVPAFSYLDILTMTSTYSSLVWYFLISQRSIPKSAFRCHLNLRSWLWHSSLCPLVLSYFLHCNPQQFLVSFFSYIRSMFLQYSLPICPKINGVKNLNMSYLHVRAFQLENEIVAGMNELATV